jgi:chemotaxis-related protein WspD
MTDEQQGALYCWKQIGVFGDSSCPRLPELVHCRNCFEYNKAGRSLLDREVPPGFLDESTKSLAEAKETEVPDAVSLIVFRTKHEWLALKTVCMQETTNVRPVHRVPFRTNNIFQGIVNINGELLLCVSLADLIEMERTDEEGAESDAGAVYSRMLVISKDGERYVFPVDEVLGVRRISLSDLQDPAATMTRSPSNVVAGIFNLMERKIGLLDEDRLVGALKRSLTN